MSVKIVSLSLSGFRSNEVGSHWPLGWQIGWQEVNISVSANFNLTIQFENEQMVCSSLEYDNDKK